MRLAVVLVALALIASCSATTIRQPEVVPRIRCMAMGHVPDSEWWLYVCTFTGDTVPPLPGPIAGVL